MYQPMLFLHWKLIRMCIAPAHDHDIEFARLQVAIVDVGNLKFAARRRFERGRNIQHVVVVEI